MGRSLLFALTVFFISCGTQPDNSKERIITVSIAPFRYFVERIAGNDFTVNVMVPAGADPHTYEPFPDQVARLRRSEGFISNGYLGFEMVWLNSFYEANRAMKKLSLGNSIEPLDSEKHEGGHTEAADPHYWLSPACALRISSAVRDFLTEMNPQAKDRYQANYLSLVHDINNLDSTAQEYFSDVPHRAFMIYHPNLAYLARDYNLEEIPVEYEGKEPSPSRIRELIDRGRAEKMKYIFVQREYDIKHAREIARETGSEIKIIDPLSEDWLETVTTILEDLHTDLSEK